VQKIMKKINADLSASNNIARRPEPKLRSGR
jgi:transposase